MKSLIFFLSIALVSTSAPNAVAHDSVGGFYQTEPGQEDAVLSDFTADLKAGTVKGLKDVAIRASSSSRIALRVAEKIMANTSARVIHCLACREPNADLKRIAKLTGIQNFLEIEYEGTKEHQELKMRITRVNDQKEEWSKTYYHDETENRETRVEVERQWKYTGFANATLMPKEQTSSMSAFGLGFRAQKNGWGIELDGERTTEGDSSFHLLLLESWKMERHRGEVWIGVGATYLTGKTVTNWNWAVRAGYDWNFSRQWIAGLWLGGRPTSPYSGLEAGLRIGFIF